MKNKAVITLLIAVFAAVIALLVLQDDPPSLPEKQDTTVTPSKNVPTAGDDTIPQRNQRPQPTPPRAKVVDTARYPCVVEVNITDGDDEAVEYELIDRDTGQMVEWEGKLTPHQQPITWVPRRTILRVWRGGRVIDASLGEIDRVGPSVAHHVRVLPSCTNRVLLVDQASGLPIRGEVTYWLDLLDDLAEQSLERWSAIEVEPRIGQAKQFAAALRSQEFAPVQRRVPSGGTLPGWRIDRYVKIVCVADGYQAVTQKVIGTLNTDLRIAMQPETTLRLTVTGEPAGGPATAIKPDLRSLQKGRIDVVHNLFAREWMYQGITPGLWRVAVVAGEATSAMDVEVVAGSNAVTVDLSAPAAEMTIRVTDTGGTPIPNLAMVLHNDDNASNTVVTTGADGVARTSDQRFLPPVRVSIGNWFGLVDNNRVGNNHNNILLSKLHSELVLPLKPGALAKFAGSTSLAFDWDSDREVVEYIYSYSKWEEVFVGGNKENVLVRAQNGKLSRDDGSYESKLVLMRFPPGEVRYLVRYKDGSFSMPMIAESGSGQTRLVAPAKSSTLTSIQLRFEGSSEAMEYLRGESFSLDGVVMDQNVFPRENQAEFTMRGSGLVTVSVGEGFYADDGSAGFNQHELLLNGEPIRRTLKLVRSGDASVSIKLVGLAAEMVQAEAQRLTGQKVFQRMTLSQDGTAADIDGLVSGYYRFGVNPRRDDPINIAESLMLNIRPGHNQFVATLTDGKWQVTRKR